MRTKLSAGVGYGLLALTGVTAVGVGSMSAAYADSRPTSADSHTRVVASAAPTLVTVARTHSVAGVTVTHSGATAVPSVTSLSHFRVV